MANSARVMSSIKDFLIKLKASDADIPEELAEDALEMVEEVKDALCEDEEEETKDAEEEETKDACEEETKDEETVTKAELEKSVEDSMVKVLRKYGVIKDTSMESLDELENKLGEETEDELNEEEVTVDPSKMNDAMKREIIRQIKPVIASVKDAKTRKKLSDKFAKALDMSYSTTTDYSSILDIVRTNQANDAASAEDYSDFGMEIAKKYNPHYKEEV